MKFTLVYGPLFPILQGRLQSWIVTIHEDNVPNNTVVNASKPINFGRYFEWMPKLQTLAETYQKATKNKVTWPLKAGKQTKQGTQPLQTFSCVYSKCHKAKGSLVPAIQVSNSVLAIFFFITTVSWMCWLRKFSLGHQGPWLFYRPHKITEFSYHSWQTKWKAINLTMKR